MAISRRNGLRENVSNCPWTTRTRKSCAGSKPACSSATPTARFMARVTNGAPIIATRTWSPRASPKPIEIKTAAGTRTQNWFYPGRQDCLTCHTPVSGGVLGVKTRQLNGDFAYPNGVTDNQLRAWNHIGLFDAKLDENDIPRFTKLVAVNDTSRAARTAAPVPISTPTARNATGPAASRRFSTPGLTRRSKNRDSSTAPSPIRSAFPARKSSSPATCPNPFSFIASALSATCKCRRWPAT